jgi:hypothetical protein
MVLYMMDPSKMDPIRLLLVITSSHDLLQAFRSIRSAVAYFA